MDLEELPENQHLLSEDSGCEKNEDEKKKAKEDETAEGRDLKIEVKESAKVDGTYTTMSAYLATVALVVHSLTEGIPMGATMFRKYFSVTDLTALNLCYSWK